MKVIELIQKKYIYTINIDKIVSIEFDKDNNVIKIYTVDDSVFIIEGKSFPVELFATIEEESIKDKFDDIKELYDTIVDYVSITVDEINKMVIDNS